jgi:hypothetical protein
MLDAKSANLIEKDALFVIGRNIYQAACGNAKAAAAFLRDFMTSTSGFTSDKRRAVLGWHVV